MGKYFGTDGFRGEANKTLTFEHAIKIGRFLGWYYGKRLDKKAGPAIWDPAFLCDKPLSASRACNKMHLAANGQSSRRSLLDTSFIAFYDFC